jgi:hypothetical protein
MSARKPRLVRPEPLSRPPEDGDVRNQPADFSDPESMRVLDAIAEALITPLAIQQAREDHAKWLASQRGHS